MTIEILYLTHQLERWINMNASFCLVTTMWMV